VKKRNPKSTGAAPGSVIFTGKRKVEDTLVHRCTFDAENIKVSHSSDPVTDEDYNVTWIDVRGIHDEEYISSLGLKFDLHPLILEDLVDVGQRPKMDEYKDAVLLNLKSLTYDRSSSSLEQEHISIIIKPNLIITMQEDVTDVFSHVRNRIVQSAGRVRSRSASYLGYSLMDNIVDNYYLVLEELDEELELLEEEITQNAAEISKKTLYDFRQKMVAIKKTVSPLRDAISKLIRSDHPALDEQIEIYLRDLLDHILHIQEQVESKREIVSSLQDLYMTEISFKMNTVMQVLTIIATIFIPLTFIVGVYGMNFKNMPELEWKYGYQLIWSLMLVIVFLLLYLFRRKKWL